MNDLTGGLHRWVGSNRMRQRTLALLFDKDGKARAAWKVSSEGSRLAMPDVSGSTLWPATK